MYVERTAFEVKSVTLKKRYWTADTYLVAVGPIDGSPLFTIPLTPDEEVPKVGTRVVMVVKEDAWVEGRRP